MNEQNKQPSERMKVALAEADDIQSKFKADNLGVTWRVNTALRGFMVGKIYKQFAQNSFNVALKNDDGNVKYVDKKFLVEVV